MRHIVTCGLSGGQYFSALYDNSERFKKVIEHKMCVLIFSTTFVRNISHSKKNLVSYCKDTYVYM